MGNYIYQLTPAHAEKEEYVDECRGCNRDLRLISRTLGMPTCGYPTEISDAIAKRLTSVRTKAGVSTG